MTKDSMPFELYMSHTLRTQLVQYCIQCLPHEGCGILEGRFVEGAKNMRRKIRMTGMIPVTNVARNSEVQFLFNPGEWVSYISHPARKGPLWGIFHSHPTSPPEPSLEDMQMEWHNNLHCYWIVSLQQPDHPQIRAYRLANQSCEAISVIYD